MGGPIVDLDLDQVSRIIRGTEMIEQLLKTSWVRQLHGPVPTPNLRHFELAAHLFPGDSALAFPRVFDGTDSYDTDTGGTKYTVHDMLAIHRGRARGAYDAPHDTGSRGIVEKRNGLWQIISMQPHALQIQCFANGAFTAEDEIITIDTVTILQPIGAILAEGLPTQIENTFADEVDNNAKIIATWDDDIDDDGAGSGSGGSGSGGSGADGKWKCLAIACPAGA